MELSADDDFGHVKFFPAHLSLPNYRQTMEFGIAASVDVYQFFTASEIVPVEVRFVHQYDGNTQEYRRVIGCPAVFGRDQIQMILNRSDPSVPITTADDRLLELLTACCEAALKENAAVKPEQITRLEHCVVDLLPSGRAKMRNVAVELGMSERSLVRHLTERGTSFSEILKRLRHQLALKYYRQPELNLTQIAFLLGYSNQSAFSTAFNRMTGQTPRTIRANAS